MDIPKLNTGKNSGRYTSRSFKQVTKLVKAYLFDGFTYRQMDSLILQLDNDHVTGFRSMEVLHYLGLNKSFKGIFRGMTSQDAVNELKLTYDSSYADLIALLEEVEISEDKCSEDIDSEISTEYVIAKEGAKKEIYGTRYERNPRLRKKAIQIHGTDCMACGFDFGAFYGERGENYIEVHHVRPLSSSPDEMNVDPNSDLVVVCANCHRMIHRKRNEILTIGELKELIEANK